MSPKYNRPTADNVRCDRKIRLSFLNLQRIHEVILKGKCNYFNTFVNEAIEEKLKRMGF